MTPRAEKALALLAAGAQFVQRLERDSYTRREQWQYRLVQNGQVHKGFGIAVFYELKDKLELVSSTSVSSYYALRNKS